MTTNDIIDGVSIKLNKLYDNFEIHANSSKQDLTMPCFFIKQLPSGKSSLVMNRYKNKLNLVIHVMLEEDTVNLQEQLNDISDKLYELEYITLQNGDILRGKEIRAETKDNVLLFFITYEYFTYKKQTEETTMENLTEKGGLKIE